MKMGPLSLVTTVGFVIVVVAIGLGMLQAEDVVNDLDTKVEVTAAAVIQDTGEDCIYFYQMDLGRWALDGNGTGDTGLVQRKSACVGEALMTLDEAHSACPWLSDQDAADAYAAWDPAVYADQIIRWPCTWRDPS